MTATARFAVYVTCAAIQRLVWNVDRGAGSVRAAVAGLVRAAGAGYVRAAVAGLVRAAVAGYVRAVVADALRPRSR